LHLELGIIEVNKAYVYICLKKVVSVKFFQRNKTMSTEQVKASVLVILSELFHTTKPELIEVKVNNKHVDIAFPFVLDALWDEVQATLKKKTGAEFTFSKRYSIPAFSAQKPPISKVKNIIAVSSGKGGVGKSANAVNLALALKSQGARVGVLDADIYGPSVPIMLGTRSESPHSPDNKTMFPIMAHGLASNSIGYLVKNDHASIWRGPMASKALTQLLSETKWPILDYLIVDMPPGTGDIQLTMCQQLPLTAAVVVTTPQDIALNDAAKGIAMFDKLNIPVLGLIENMSYIDCGHCHQKTAIFGKQGAQKLSDKHALPLLAKVPLDPIVGEFADAGRSLIDERSEHSISVIYKQAAIDITRYLCEEADVLPMAANMASNIEITNIE
jgi:ATP-binding protein involved in chromosome partitioning